MNTYGIIFPVYNEEKRIENGIVRTQQYIDAINADVNILIVDNGSTDGTEEIAVGLCKQYANTSYIKIADKGVGIAFKEGVSRLHSDIVGYMDIDLSADISYFSKVVSLFEKDKNIDLVNGSRFNKKSIIEGRKWYRLLTSRGLVVLLKLFFKMKSSDAICGFKFFKSDSVRKLLSESSNEKGWFLIIEMLLRAERDNMNIAELPIHWIDDNSNSTVDVLGTIKNYIEHIIQLKKTFAKETRNNKH